MTRIAKHLPFTDTLTGKQVADASIEVASGRPLVVDPVKRYGRPYILAVIGLMDEGSSRIVVTLMCRLHPEEAAFSNITVADLAKLTDLTPAQVTGHLGYLVDIGMVYTTEWGGGQPVTVHLNELAWPPPGAKTWPADTDP